MFWRATDRASRWNDRSSKSDLKRPSYEEITKHVPQVSGYGTDATGARCYGECCVLSFANPAKPAWFLAAPASSLSLSCERETQTLPRTSHARERTNPARRAVIVSPVRNDDTRGTTARASPAVCPSRWLAGRRRDPHGHAFEGTSPSPRQGHAATATAQGDIYVVGGSTRGARDHAAKAHLSLSLSWCERPRRRIKNGDLGRSYCARDVFPTLLNDVHLLRRTPRRGSWWSLSRSLSYIISRGGASSSRAKETKQPRGARAHSLPISFLSKHPQRRRLRLRDGELSRRSSTFS